MECWRALENNFGEDTSDHYYSSVYENTIEDQLKSLDIKKLVENLPEEFTHQLCVTVDIFSREKSILHPCQKKEIKTGVIIKTYLPITHCVYFDGVTNNLGISALGKCIIPIVEKELTVNVFNASTKIREIPTSMPLGKIIIKSNL